jgi:signal transduction histidine kinase
MAFEAVQDRSTAFHSLGRYVLLLLLTVILCLLALQLSLPEPPEIFRFDQAEVSADGRDWRNVALPRLEPDRQARSIYRIAFPGQGKDTGLWSVYLPRFTARIEVAVNGVLLFDSHETAASIRPDRNIPEILPLPAPAIKPGENLLTIALSQEGPLSGFLDRIYIGPDAALRPAYDLRNFVFVVLPLVFAAWQVILGIILAAIWFSRRKEPAYGVLAAVMAAGVLQGFFGVAAGYLPAPILGAAPPLEAVLMLLFIMLALGCRLPRYYPIVFVPPAAIVLSGLTGLYAVQRLAWLVLGPPTVGIAVAVALVLLARSALGDNRGTSFYLGPPVAAVLTCWVHDFMTLTGYIDGSRIFVGRFSYSAVLIAIGMGMAWRFVQALNEIDSFAERLVVRVREAEERLRESFAREEIRARNEALAAERTRLMRDLHDGLGGQLVSIVALTEQTASGDARIGDAARAALRDLRLVIDAMDDIDGDLMLVLGSWRERTAAQLRPHGMVLDWQVSGQGLPVVPELRPWHVIQVLRLLDEAVTNAMKHSGSSTVRVGIETLSDQQGQGGAPTGRITVEDDGHGFALDGRGSPPAAGTGRGLLNMQRRASLCGATLTITSGAGGTALRLDLPSRFPSAEAR